ncbi:MAG: hypothetical protein C0597_05275 [Marinilabiliales bacterium]|nr:MAG: hypothetical protein C0597_05275 [Marinilabiliales bacterium]
MDNDHYELNQKGLIIDFFREIKKPVNSFANLKTANALLYVMAGLFAKERKLDDCILINENGNLVEGISSNIFIIKGDKIFTPPLKDGPVAGIMRKQILKIANKHGLKINHESSLTEEHLISADEVFLTNVISGIRWVLAYKDRRYFNHIAHQFIDKLNIMAFDN